MIIELEDIGLAAFIKMNGGKLLRVKEQGKKKAFEFEIADESQRKSLDEWRIDYLNSCCQRHDLEVITLRRLKSQ